MQKKRIRKILTILLTSNFLKAKKRQILAVQ